MRTLENSNLFLLFPIVLAVLALFNLADELMIRYLHKKGTKGTATVTRVKRSMPKDRFRFLTAKDDSNTYDTKCDYILSLKYARGGEEIEIKNLIVPALIKMSGGLAFPAFKSGDAVPIRYSEKLKKRVVIDNPEVKKAQNRVIDLLLWIICVAMSVMMLVAMLITK